ncbi:MAG: prolyl oligopeptidase family serine peptidase [Acinetobacter sp.]|nr:prolyl oligopeptidase family serine peptidase [Acinetobacter sp.]
MKLNKLAVLVASLSGLMAVSTAHAESDTSKKAEEVTYYPYTATVAERPEDRFLTGEYGRPNLVTMSGTLRIDDGAVRGALRPDDGKDHYFREVVEDKYRWLEDVDPISPEYRKEKDADRERNLAGSRMEGDRLEKAMVGSPAAGTRTADGLRASDRERSRGLDALKKVEKNPVPSEVQKWTEEQNKVTDSYFAQVPYFDQIGENIKGLMTFEHTIRKVNKDKVGEIHFFRGTDGHSRIHYTDLDGIVHEWVNEKNLSADGQTMIDMGDIWVSKEGSYFVYYTRTGYSDTDKRYLHVVKTTTGEEVAKIAPMHYGSTYNDIEWIDDHSFFYLRDRNGWTDVHLHDVRKKQGAIDPAVMVGANYVDASGSGAALSGLSIVHDRYLVISAWQKQYTFYIYDMQTKKVTRFHTQEQAKKFARQDGSGSVGDLTEYIDMDKDTGDVWFISYEDYSGAIYKSNLKDPSKRELVVPVNKYYQHMEEAVRYPQGQGYFLIHYRKDNGHRVILTDSKGKLIKDLTPEQGPGYIDDIYAYVPGKTDDANKSADAVVEKEDEGYVSFRYSSVVQPRTWYHYSPEKGEFTDKYRRDMYPFDESQFETKQAWATSKDGTQIPMSISHKKGIVLNGKNPTVVYGYGGFGIAQNNQFRPEQAAWMENGGVWVNVTLRGGSDYGEAWHRDGKHDKKMNVFNDFAAAADYMAANGYATSDYIASSGASNGGLLVAATSVLFPDKFRVAIPEKGVLDMYRQADNYHTDYWVHEYGTPFDSKEYYEILKSYSPYHNVKDGVCYPSTLVMTARYDDRVTPSHSYKYAAALQNAKQSCETPRPMLLDVHQTEAHWPNTYADRMRNYQRVIAFRLSEMGVGGVPVVTSRPTADQLKTEKQKKDEAEALAKKQEAIQKRAEERKQGIFK